MRVLACSQQCGLSACGCHVCVGVAFMADLEAADQRLSFDDILEAVQDSRRGRWFLQEYQQRLQQRDSKPILDAISRLEARMESLAPHAAPDDDMAKVRSAIATARQDLMKLGLGNDPLSKEGRLFAHLADMARKAMPVAIDSNAGIVRTLQLVEEIDRAIAPPTPDHGAKYFAADSNLFERQAAPAKPALVPTVVEPAVAAPAAEPLVVVKAAPAAKAAPSKDEAPAGARLVIRKAQASKPQDEAIVEASVEPASATAVPALEAAPIAAHQAEPATAEPVSTPQVDSPRIVIIRRKPEDMPEVNLDDTSLSGTAA
jgi:hypothetical protein